jgi:intracellular multiplication protein IcmO
MVVDAKFQYQPGHFLRDTRTYSQRIKDGLSEPSIAIMIFTMMAVLVIFVPAGRGSADFLLLASLLYFWWFIKRPVKLPMKMPVFSPYADPNERDKKPQGILYLGNQKKSNDELWLSNTDAKTHILYLGTTGAGKTVGLISLAANALTWSSGFIFIDGKADTSLYASLYALARRFGRDDDMLVLNYLTGNSDMGSASNSINPFSSGSASYLTNLVVSLMDEAKGENAMWKGRAVALMGAMMPVLTWKRDNQKMRLDVTTIQEHLSLQAVIRLSRDTSLPDRITAGLKNYLETLPGFTASAFDDQGNEAPPGPNDPPRDTTVPFQQHGFLAMQFTRALQSLSGDYGYIFGAQLADIIMQDVVLNRRILVVLIPSLEKSADEAANLGKIIASMIKGMMGSTLGNTIEGDWSGAIDNKPTNSASPFMTIFDEVGYYTAQGMAVMAAQARSLGFSLVFASQDIPSMELRVKEEARSITANCNLKIFGKLEESIDTRNFFEKSIGSYLVTESQGFKTQPEKLFTGYNDGLGAAKQVWAKADWGDLRDQKEGEVHMTFRADVIAAKMFYAAPKPVKAMRVHKMLGVKAPAPVAQAEARALEALVGNLQNPKWTAAGVQVETEESETLDALLYGFQLASQAKLEPRQRGAMAVAALSTFMDPEKEEDDDLDSEFENFLALDRERRPELTAETHPGLPVPDSEEDDIFAGLLKPHTTMPEAQDADEASADISGYHPALSPEVNALLIGAAEQLTLGLEGAMAGSAE